MLIIEFLLEAVVDRVLSPVFDRITGLAATIILLIGCVMCFALWWVSGAVLVLVLSGLFGVAAAVALIQPR